MARSDLHAWLSGLTGVELSRGGVSRTLDALVDRRCNALGCSIDEYLKLAQAPGSPELEQLTNAVTVVYTWFFRDREQLAAIEELLLERRNARPIQVWVPGCATGEDALSIAMLAARLGVTVSVLATDINSQALAGATRNDYAKGSLRDVKEEFKPYFTRDGNRFKVAEEIRKQVRFERHNLLDPVPSSTPGGGWDLILCRNVLIYFHPREALRIFDRLLRALQPGGYLMLGSSEVVYDVPSELEALYVGGRLALRRKGPLAAAPTREMLLPRQTLVPPSGPHPHHAPLPALPPQVRAVPSAASSTTPRPPPEQNPILERGHEYLDRGQLVEALSEYERACRENDTCPQARLYRGVTHYLCGAVREAADDLRAALFLDDKLWPAAFYLALSYESMGLPRDALREYRHVVRLCEDLPSKNDADALLSAWRHDVLELSSRRLRAANA